VAAFSWKTGAFQPQRAAYNRAWDEVKAA